MTKTQRANIFARLQKANPRPTTELNYNSPFELLVAVILSAQATDVAVNHATAKLFAEANTPEAIAKMGLPKLKRHIKTIGLFNNKAKNIIATCRILVKKHDSTVPDNRADLEALPGVGRKTANVILNTAYRQPVIAVDTHIFRVANRTGLGPGKTPLEVEQALTELCPPQYLQHAHHWLILHGRYTCIARRPKCGLCPINDLCEYDAKTPAVAQIP